MGFGIMAALMPFTVAPFMTVMRISTEATTEASRPPDAATWAREVLPTAEAAALPARALEPLADSAMVEKPGDFRREEGPALAAVSMAVVADGAE
jgi:hypothetical protein